MIDSFTGEYRWLSNFWPANVRCKGVEFDTVEHAYQAAKAVYVDDFFDILAAPTPGEAKKIGKQITIRDNWDDIKLRVMTGLLRQKFWYNGLLRKQLLSTGDEELVEGNYWGDTFWGVCRGEGENHLGKLIMQIREDIRNHGSN